VSILVYDEIWVREPRLMVPGVKPLGPVEVDWSSPMAQGLTNFVMFNGSVTINLVNGLLARNAVDVKVIRNGNWFACYNTYGLNINGTGNATNYENSLIKLSPSAAVGFSFAANTIIRKDYAAETNSTDYAFGASGTNVATSYAFVSSVTTGYIRAQYDNRTLIPSFVPAIGDSIKYSASTINVTVDQMIIRNNVDVYTGSSGSVGGTEESMYLFSDGSSGSTRPLVEYIATWNGPRGFSFMRDFFRDPYQFLIPA